MDIPDASDLVEDSLRTLDEAGVSDAEFRAAASTLYEFESEYESRPTFFRMMDVHERRGYFLTLPVDDHPRYGEHREHLDSIDPGTVSPVLRHPSETWDGETNPVVGYANSEDLYVERGSELFDELIEAGQLTDEEGVSPDGRSLYAAVADVAEAADDLDLVLRWYAALGFHLGMESEEDEDELLAELKDDPDVERFRRIVADIDDLEMKLHHPGRELDIPPPPLREAHPVLKWWFELM